ncbi:MAG: cell division protein ZapA [Immundisolibacteraceae bacterium]|nr:cell division protein ZapA [Immundisolibacteraceae bacterium]
MAENQQGVPVKILEQEYVIACAPEEQAQLQATAEFVNQKLAEIRGGNKGLGTERLMVLAVLNIANDLLVAEDARRDQEESLGRVARIQQRLETVFAGAEAQLQLS